MSRTQIYLGPSEIELLDRASRATGASRSELIRRAIHDTYGERSAAEKLRALRTWALCLTGGEPTLHPQLPELGVPGANTRKFTDRHNYFFIKDLQRL